MKWTVQRYVLREVVQTWLAVTGRLGGHPGVESAIAGAGPSGRQPVRAARGVRSDRARRDHESVGHRAGRPVAGRRADAGAHVPRQRDGGAASVRVRAVAAAGAAVLLCRGDRRWAWPGWCSCRCRAPTVKRSCCANRRSRRRNSGNSMPGGSARSAAVMPCSTPSGSIRRACCTTYSCSARSAGEIEVALADTATYSKAAADGVHLVTLFNGRRYEGVPGTRRFSRDRVSRARHPDRHARGCRRDQGPGHQADAGTARLGCTVGHRATAIQGIHAADGAGADPDRRAPEPPAAAPGPLRPGRLRHRRVFRLFEPAVRRQGVGREGRSAARDRGVVGARWRSGPRVCTWWYAQARTA